MRFIFIAMALVSTSLALGVQCQDIHITDNCHAVGNVISKLFSYQTQISFICETQNNQRINRTIDFKSLRAEYNCGRFQESISQGNISLQSIENIAHDLKNPAKLSVIGDNLLNTRQQRIEAQSNSYRNNSSKTSLSEAMKYRRQ